MTILGLSTRSASRRSKEQQPAPLPPSPSSHNSAYSETLSNGDDLAPALEDAEVGDSEDPLTLLPLSPPPAMTYSNEDEPSEQDIEPDVEPDEEMDDDEPSSDEEEEEEEEEDEDDDELDYESEGEADAVRREMAALLETVPDLQAKYRLVDRLGEGEPPCGKNQGPH